MKKNKTWILALFFLLLSGGTAFADIVWDGDEENYEEEGIFLGFRIENLDDFQGYRFFVLSPSGGFDEDEPLSWDTLFFDPLLENKVLDKDYGHKIYAFPLNDPSDIHVSGERIMGEWTESEDFFADEWIDVIEIKTIKDGAVEFEILERRNANDFEEEDKDGIPFLPALEFPAFLLMLSLFGLGLILILARKRRALVLHGDPAT